MHGGAFAQIARVGLGADQFHERVAAEFLRQLPRSGLVEPHQRRLEQKAPVHAERQRDLHRLERVVAAVGIARVIRLAHAADQHVDVAPVGDRGRVCEEQQVAARNERVRQPRVRHPYLGCAGERGARQLPQLAHRDEVIFTEPARPAREAGAQSVQHERPHLEFDGVPLSVVEPDRLDLAVAVERPGEAGGGILTSGEQHESPRMHAGSVEARPARRVTATARPNPAGLARPVRGCARPCRGPRARRPARAAPRSPGRAPPRRRVRRTRTGTEGRADPVQVLQW